MNKVLEFFVGGGIIALIVWKCWPFLSKAFNMIVYVINNGLGNLSVWMFLLFIGIILFFLVIVGGYILLIACAVVEDIKKSK